MNKLMSKMIKSTKIKGADVLLDSKLFSEKEIIQTEIPAINIALSGDLDGGLRNQVGIDNRQRINSCDGYFQAIAQSNLNHNESYNVDIWQEFIH